MSFLIFFCFVYFFLFFSFSFAFPVFFQLPTMTPTGQMRFDTQDSYIPTRREGVVRYGGGTVDCRCSYESGRGVCQHR